MIHTVLLVALSVGQSSDVRTLTEYDWFRDYDSEIERRNDAITYEAMTFQKKSRLEGDVWHLEYIYRKLGNGKGRLWGAYTTKGKYKINPEQDRVYIGFYERYRYFLDEEGSWKKRSGKDFEEWVGPERGVLLKFSVRKDFGTKDKFKISLVPERVVETDEEGNPKGIGEDFSISSVLRLDDLEVNQWFDTEERYTFYSHNNYPIPEHIKSPIGRYFRYRPHFRNK